MSKKILTAAAAVIFVFGCSVTANKHTILSLPTASLSANAANEQTTDENTESSENDEEQLDEDDTSDKPQVKLSISKAAIGGVSTSYTYTSKAITPTVTVKVQGKKLAKNTDYTVSYKNNIKTGQAVIKITGKGSYTGEITKTFKIIPAKLSSKNISGLSASYSYTGKAVKPTVKVIYNNKKLKNGVDYKIAYSKNLQTGTARLAVIGKGNFSGKAIKTFKITPINLTKAKISGIKTSYAYTGKNITPTPIVKVGGKKLAVNKSYKVYYRSSKNKGTAYVIIKGTGNYTGRIVKKFTVKPVNISKIKISPIKSKYKYTGKNITPDVSLTYGKTQLKNNKDYTVKYVNNKNIGAAAIIIKGKGNYFGELKKTFKISRWGFSKIGGNTYYFDSNGQKITGIKKIGKHTYYFNSDGVMQTSWQEINGKYYFFSRKNGRRIVGKEVDGIKIAKDGSIKKSQYNISKIDVMMAAHKVVLENTLPTDSMETKKLKCFKWIFQFPYHQFRKIGNIYQNKGWEITFANDIFKFKSGCCMSEAAAMAFIFHEIGYDTVYVCHDTGHGWVELDGKFYDPLFAEARGFDGNYAVPVSTGVYRSNPVQKRKI